jgi:hypothetical protein
MDVDGNLEFENEIQQVQYAHVFLLLSSLAGVTVKHP